MVLLFGAAVAVIAVGRATAPAYTDGDITDSDLILPLILALAVLAMAAGYRTGPRTALLLGLIAVLPFLAYIFGIGYPLTGEQRTFMWMGFVFSLPVLGLIGVCPLVGAGLRKYRRQRKVSSPEQGADHGVG